MSNALAKVQTGGLLALLDAHQDAGGSGLADELNVSTGSGARLKFDGRTGFYTFNDAPLEKGSEFIFNFFETTKAKLCWKNKRPVDRHEIKVLSKETLPPDSALADHGPYDDGEGWQTSITFMVLSTEDGSQATFTLSSYGGRAAAVKLFDKWALEQRMNLDDDGNPLYPLVSLSSDKRTTKAGNTIFVPVFEITDWVSQADMGEIVGAKPEPKPAAKPAAKIGFGSGVRGRRTA